MALVAGYEGIFDADDLNGAADNSAVATITIGSNSATQASSGSRATLRKSRKNGKSAIEFDGSNDFYDFGDIFDLHTNNLQIFIYAKFVGGTFFAKSGGVSAGRYGFYKYSGALEAFYEGPSSVIADSTALSADTDFHLYEFQINRVTGKLRCYRDATLIVDASFTPDLATDRDTADTFTLGKYSTASPLPFEGEIAYLVPYLRSTEFSGGEITQNRDYINSLFTPPDSTPPSDVTNLTATKISNSRVDLDSDTSTDDNSVAGYQTQVSTDGGSSWNTLSATTKAVSFVSGNTHFPTTPGTYSLTFRRKAFDTASTPNYSNNWSNIPTAVSITVAVSPPVASFTLSSSTVVVGGTITLTDTSTNTPTSRQWKLDEENLATTSPYALDTTGLEIGEHTIDLNASNSGGSDDAEPQTFEVIESFIAEFFEELKICKLFNITDLELEMPLLSADFGDGYETGVLSGKPSGLRRWSISADPILNSADYNIDFIVDGEPQTDTPFNYFLEFFRRHIALGNKPFYFVEPRTNRKFLASFVGTRLPIKVFTKEVYGIEAQIKQRRVVLEGLEFRESDGSINE